MTTETPENAGEVQPGSKKDWVSVKALEWISNRQKD